MGGTTAGHRHDFALLHFVEFTIAASYEAIQIEKCGVRIKERTEFYDPEEVAAAKAAPAPASGGDTRRSRQVSQIRMVTGRAGA